MLLEPERPNLVWDTFHENFTRSCFTCDFFARGSVNYTSNDRGSRLIFSFWGRTSFPVRMDLQAGVGTMLAHWREDAQGWLGFTPGNQEALFSQDSRTGAAAMGLAMPLRLNVLAQILTGCWDTLIPENYSSALCTEQYCEYHVELHEQHAILTLDMDGRPRNLQQNAFNGWNVNIEQWLDDAPRSPKRMVLHQEQNRAVVRVQHLEVAAGRWHESDLSLQLPPGTMLRFLEPLQ